MAANKTAFQSFMLLAVGKALQQNDNETAVVQRYDKFKTLVGLYRKILSFTVYESIYSMAIMTFKMAYLHLDIHMCLN